jgi:hypothetical protein
MTNRTITSYSWPANSALFHGVKGLIFLRGYPESLAFKVGYLYRDTDRNLPIENMQRLKETLFNRIRRSYNHRILEYDLTYQKLSKEFLSKFNVEGFKLVKSEDFQNDAREESGIFNVYPRTFVCRHCSQYRHFTYKERLKTKCERPGCNGKYEQLSVLKFCESCGRVEEFYYRCENRSNHPSGAHESMTFKRPVRDEPITWKFVCDVCGTERDPLNMWCNHKLPNGNVIAERDKTKVKIMTLREGSIFTPVVVNTVDLPNTDNITMHDVEHVLLAISIGKFDSIKDQLESSNILKSINNMKRLYNDQENKKLAYNMAKNYKPDITEKEFENDWKSQNKMDQIETAIQEVKGSFDIKKIDLESFNNFNALKGLFSDEKDIVTYGEFIDNTHEEKEVKLANYNFIKNKFKLKEISYLSRLKLISSCIGTINGINRFYESEFVPHFEPIWKNYKKDDILAYSYPYETEGMLFEFDENKIVEWLKINGFEVTSKSPREFLLKLEKDSEEYEAVYTLLHTLSHILLKKSSLHTGLDEQSCGEMVFPNNCAILLLSTSNINIGGFGFIFENYLYELFTEADFELRKCIYDPLCIKEKGACFSCMYLPEHVCHNMNRGLDRGVLVGNVRKIKEKFW